jgi:hypothetical protein
MTELMEWWERLSARAEKQIKALVSALVAGDMDRDEFLMQSSLRIYAANSAAARLSNQLPPIDEVKRLQKSFSTILATSANRADELEMRTARLARSEPLSAGHAAYQTSLAEQGVTGWRRQPQPDGACELCLSLAGEIHPMSDKWWDHPGCRCLMIPAEFAVVPPRTPPKSDATGNKVTRVRRFSSGLSIERD